MLPKAERQAYRDQQERERRPERKRYQPPTPAWMVAPPPSPKQRADTGYAFHEGVTDSSEREDKRERHRKQLAEVRADT
jgi:hypothetical protein